MPSRGFYLTPETADRIEEVLNTVEGTYKNSLQPPGIPRGRGSNVQRLRITASPSGSLDGITYKSARLQQWDSVAGEWVNAPNTANDDLWAFDEAGGEMDEGDLVWGRQVGNASPLVSATPTPRPTFAVIVAGGGGSDCTATCFENIDPASLTGAFSSGDCTFTPDYYADQYCGPICVTSEACPEEESDCSACVSIYMAGELVGELTSETVDEVEYCQVDFTGSPTEFVKGCFEVSDTPLPNSIAVINTDEPFYAEQDPEDCEAPWTYVYTLRYIRGAFTKTEAPDEVIFRASDTAVVPAIVGTAAGDSTATTTVADANQAAVVAMVATDAGVVAYPAGVIHTGELALTPANSGKIIRGAGAGASTLLLNLGHASDGALRIFNCPYNTSKIQYFQPYGVYDPTHIVAGHDTGGGGNIGVQTQVGSAAWFFAIYPSVNYPMAFLTEITEMTSIGGENYDMTLADSLPSPFDDPLTGVTHMKATQLGAIVDSVSGYTAVLLTAAHASRFVPGEYALLCKGPVFNELWSKRFTVESIDVGSGTVTFQEEITAEDYEAGLTALVPGPFVQKGSIENLKVGGTLTGPIYSILLYQTIGYVIRNVRSVEGHPSLTRDSLFFSHSHDFLVEDYEGVLEIASSTNGVIRRSKIIFGNHLANRDITFEDCDFYGPLGMTNGTQRFKFIRCKFFISGATINAVDLPGCCEDILFEDCEIHSCPGGFQLGNAARVVLRRVRGMAGVASFWNFQVNCTDCILEDVSNTAIVLTTGTTGFMRGVDAALVSGAAINEDGWDIQYSGVTQFRSNQIIADERVPWYHRDGTAAGNMPLFQESLTDWHYTFNESNGNALDSSGNGLTLTNFGCTAEAGDDDNLGGARVFHDPFNQRFERATNTPYLVPTAGVRSIVLLARIDIVASTVVSFCGMMDSSAFEDSQWDIGYHDGPEQFYLRVGLSDTTGLATVGSTFGAVVPGTWYLIYAEIDDDAKNLSIWVNNDGPDVVSYAGKTLGTPTMAFYVGRSVLDPNHGAVGDLLSVSRALTQTERDYLWNSGSLRPWPLVIAGDGSGLSNLDASAITTGTVPAANLPAYLYAAAALVQPNYGP